MTQDNRVLSAYHWLRWPMLLLSAAGMLFLAAWRLTWPDILQTDGLLTTGSRWSR